MVFPIKNGDFPVRYVTNYQRVIWMDSWDEHPWLSTSHGNPRFFCYVNSHTRRQRLDLLDQRRNEPVKAGSGGLANEKWLVDDYNSFVHYGF